MRADRASLPGDREHPRQRAVLLSSGLAVCLSHLPTEQYSCRSILEPEPSRDNENLWLVKWVLIEAMQSFVNDGWSDLTISTREQWMVILRRAVFYSTTRQESVVPFYAPNIAAQPTLIRT